MMEKDPFQRTCPIDSEVPEKQKNAHRPHRTERRKARFHSPVSLKKACIAAQTGDITPRTPGRTFPTLHAGLLAAGGNPSLFALRRYFFRSSWLTVLYYQRAPPMSRN